MPAGNVHDAEPPMAQANVAVEKQSSIVRAAMNEHVPHPLEDMSLEAPVTSTRERYSADATHDSISSTTNRWVGGDHPSRG
jgi:hypothetical protein